MDKGLKYTKIHYLGFVITTILVGLGSRMVKSIPVITGDLLYAVMIYWLCRFLFFKQSLLLSFLIALTFCFVIECLQMIQTPGFVYIRNNPILRLVFGQGFLWSDLLGYCIGVSIAWLLDKSIFSKAKIPFK